MLKALPSPKRPDHREHGGSDVRPQRVRGETLAVDPVCERCELVRRQSPVEGLALPETIRERCDQVGAEFTSDRGACFEEARPCEEAQGVVHAGVRGGPHGLKLGGGQIALVQHTLLDQSAADAGHAVVRVVRVHLAGGPLLARPEPDHGLDHVERARVRRRFGAPALAHHDLDLGERAQQRVASLQVVSGLRDADPRRRHRHVEDLPLIERREEVGAESGCRAGRRCDQERERGRDDARAPEQPVEHRAVCGRHGPHEP